MTSDTVGIFQKVRISINVGIFVMSTIWCPNNWTSICPSCLVMTSMHLQKKHCFFMWDCFVPSLFLFTFTSIHLLFPVLGIKSRSLWEQGKHSPPDLCLRVHLVSMKFSNSSVISNAFQLLCHSYTFCVSFVLTKSSWLVHFPSQLTYNHLVI